MLSLVLCAVCLAIAVLILYARWNYGKLRGLGFPVIKPYFIVGSAPDLHKKVQHYEDIERYKKYGAVWGYYQGRTPIVFIADPELIRAIFVKDNSHFYNREPLEFGDPFLNQILDFLPDEKWKAMRITQTKLFSLAKLKQYTNDLFNASMDEFMTKLDADLKGLSPRRLKIDARNRFCTYTVDAIGRTMFSMKIDPETDTKFYNACKKLIGEGQEINQFYVWTLTFPFLSKYAPTLVLDHAMTDRFLELVNLRAESGSNYGDYVDVMVNCFKLLESVEYQRLGITKETILGQAANLFLAGFDRISSHMSFLAFHLAQNPQIQDKLVAEIREVLCGPALDQNCSIDYNQLQKMEYLNACALEISRLYSVLIRPERVCKQDWYDPTRRIKIPKGVLVMIASWAVNRSPTYYEQPNAFIPERFMPENKGKLDAYAFTTFGFGHRNCIGMRFAYDALKFSMARLLLRYKFELREDTTLAFKKGINFIVQFEPLLLDIVEREQ